MKLPSGIQYEVWAPEQSGAQFPKPLVHVGFSRDEAIAEVDRQIEKGIKAEDLLIVVGSGFDVYHITAEDLRDTG